MKAVSYFVLIAASIVSGAVAAQSYSSSTKYDNPSNETTALAKKNGPCSDPWLTIALTKVYGSADIHKCNASLYNGGRWSDYNQLVHAVAKAKGSVYSPTAPNFGLNPIAPRPLAAITAPAGRAGLADHKMTAQEAQAQIRAKGGNLTLAQANQLVAAGGGNLTLLQVLGLVAAGGGNLVGNDGSTFKVGPNGSLIDYNGSTFRLSGGNVVPTGAGR